MRVKWKVIGIRFMALAAPAYLGSYLLVVQPRMSDHFLQWRGHPRRMDPDYRMSGRWLHGPYQPLVRLDQHLFPKRWQWQPSEAEQRAWQPSLTASDLERIHKYALEHTVHPVPTAAPESGGPQ